jgi:hypothetical protein
LKVIDMMGVLGQTQFNEWAVLGLLFVIAETPRPLRATANIREKQISVRREKALCFSGCDSRPASKHVPAGRNRSGQWR